LTELGWSWLGRVRYGPMLERQRERREAVIQGTLPEVLWLLEHEPVITTGRRTVPDLPSPKELEERGIELAHTERGGLATFHGPGQLVAYGIIDSWGRGLGVKGTIHALEEGVIQWLDSLSIVAHRRPGFPGVWVGNEKICAIGMHFRRGVSMHGIALNLDPDLAGFQMITPCGITDAGLTSVARLCGQSKSPEEVAPTLAPTLIHHLLRPCGHQSRRTG
jgi:lipoyl(octanoyl) transferase